MQSSIVLGKVDITTEAAIANKFGVRFSFIIILLMFMIHFLMLLILV